MNRRFETRILFILLVTAAVLVACGDKPEDTPPTPTVAQTHTATASPSATTEEIPSPEPSMTIEAVESPTENPNQTPPSATFPPTITPTSTGTPAPPTETPTATFTPGPYEHTIQAGDDCIGILYQYGHVDLDALQAFYDLNNMGGNCILPSVGAVVEVPRPTPGPGQSAVVDVNAEPIATVWHNLPPIEAYATYCVVQDDTLTSMALKNNTSLRKMCELNPLPDGLDCRGCDFSQSDVGSCPNPPLLSVGDCFVVPGPTPTPSGTPLPTGNETATATPTHIAPLVVYPQDGLTVSGSLRLQWASVGLLRTGEVYVVNLRDETAGTLFINATRNTYMDVPREYMPQDGQAHQVVWSVSVQTQNQDGIYVPIGGTSKEFRFIWQ